MHIIEAAAEPLQRYIQFSVPVQSFAKHGLYAIINNASYASPGKLQFPAVLQDELDGKGIPGRSVLRLKYPGDEGQRYTQIFPAHLLSAVQS